MKRIFIMDDDGLKEYVPLESLQKQKDSVIEKSVEEASKEEQLLTIADLVKKFKVTRPTIYAWINKGLLKKIPLGGRVLFHPDDINGLIDRMRNLPS
jgi:excisionase family DNA binding protein